MKIAMPQPHSGSRPSLAADDGAVRLLIVSPFLPPSVGGVERVTEWMCEVLPRRGFTVRTAGHPVGGGSGDLLWPSVAEPLGVPIPTPSIGSLRRVARALRWADVVVVQNAFWPLSNVVSIELMFARRPALSLIHANAALPMADPPRWLLLAEHLHARTLAALQLRVAPPLAISQSSQRFVRDHYHRHADILPLPLPDGLPPMRPPLPRRDPLRIVVCGRLAPVKAPADAIRACEIARQRINLTLDVVGGGPLEESLRAGSPDWVRFHGAQPWRSALALVGAADLVVSSSITDNAQTAMLEALCLGVPAVATDVGETSDYLLGGLRRGIAPAGNPGRLAECIMSVARNHAEVQSLTRKRAIELRRRHRSDDVADVLAERLRAAAGAA